MQIQRFLQHLIAWNVTMENIQQVGCVLIVLMEHLLTLGGWVYVHRAQLASLSKVDIGITQGSIPDIGLGLVLPAQLGQAPILQITYIFVQCSARRESMLKAPPAQIVHPELITGFLGLLSVFLVHKIPLIILQRVSYVGARGTKLQWILLWF
tara:strand:+ start:20513 stop:20971 length:459 start_codon:yes stop_codon:yes gene_type:complete